MANPSFKKSNQTDEYVWESIPSRPGSSRADYDGTIQQSKAVLEHSRHKVIYARAVIQLRGIWLFQWKNITEAEVLSYRTFYEQAFFLYYPDSGLGTYFQVYIPNGRFEMTYKRGGTYDLMMELRQYTAFICSSSSSSASSSSSSSSSSNSGV